MEWGLKDPRRLSILFLQNLAKFNKKKFILCVSLAFFYSVTIQSLYGHMLMGIIILRLKSKAKLRNNLLWYSFELSFDKDSIRKISNYKPTIFWTLCELEHSFFKQTQIEIKNSNLTYICSIFCSSLQVHIRFTLFFYIFLLFSFNLRIR